MCGNGLDKRSAEARKLFVSLPLHYAKAYCPPERTFSVRAGLVLFFLVQS